MYEPNPPERWLPVPGYEGLYEVSDWGRVKSMPRNTTSGRILKPQPVNKYGHLKVSLSRDGVVEQHLVHKLVMEAFAGPCPPGQEVCHNNGDPGNNRRSNLRYDTRPGNMEDMLAQGRGFQQNKTHCPQKHEYTPDNTFIDSKGGRGCLTCLHDQKQAAWATKKERMRTDAEYRAQENAKSAERARRARARKRTQGESDLP